MPRAGGATTVRRFDDSWVVAGQGTAGLEAARDAAAMGVTFGSLICNASGGGLLAGVAVAFEELSPSTEVYVSEPEGHDDLIRSLAEKRIVANAPGTRSIADALMSPEPGVLPFEIHKRRVAGGFTATNHQLLDAMSFSFHHLKLVVEPGWANGFAAVLHNRAQLAAVGPVLISRPGGNVDSDWFAKSS